MPRVFYLRELRQRKVMSQDDLAVRARLSRGTIQRIEAGEDARPDTIRKIAAALLVDPEELVTPRLL